MRPAQAYCRPTDDEEHVVTWRARTHRLAYGGVAAGALVTSAASDGAVAAGFAGLAVAAAAGVLRGRQRTIGGSRRGALESVPAGSAAAGPLHRLGDRVSALQGLLASAGGAAVLDRQSAEEVLRQVRDLEAELRELGRRVVALEQVHRFTADVLAREEVDRGISSLVADLGDGLRALDSLARSVAELLAASGTRSGSQAVQEQAARLASRSQALRELRRAGPR